MSIQANINQGLSLASFLITQNPKLQEIHQKEEAAKELENQVNVLEKQRETIGKSRTKVSTEVKREVADKLAAIRKQQFENDPTEQTYAAYVKARKALKAKQSEKRNTRRNFSDYMKDTPTSFGVSLGELAPNLQKSILKEYSSSERKKIMDRKDSQNV